MKVNYEKMIEDNHQTNLYRFWRIETNTKKLSKKDFIYHVQGV